MTAACSSATEPTSTPRSGVRVHGDVIRGYGVVDLLNVEGGLFVIRGDNGVIYDPYDRASLPDALRRDGLRVRFTARFRRDAIGIHGGPMVEIDEIARL